MKKVLVFADKKRNMEKSHNKKLLPDNITKKYKKSTNKIYNSINLKVKHIAKKKLEIADRVDYMAQKPDYKILKDHEENVNISRKCRLINPAKRKLGKVAKKL